MIDYQKSYGKTVSINYYLINEEFYFIDLPGYGFAKISKKESERVKALVADFFEKTENIKLIVILIDSRRGFMNSDLEILLKIVEKNFKVLTTLTKCDKVNNSFLENQIKSLQDRFGLSVIPFSIKSNVGKEKLIKYINKALQGVEKCIH
jgi:GTP-binding protein